MYKVWIKRNYREIQGIDEGTYKIVLKSVMECETCKYYSVKPFYHYFVCPFTNTLNFSGQVPQWDHWIWNLLEKNAHDHTRNINIRPYLICHENTHPRSE